jgi:hypothetical protein
MTWRAQEYPVSAARAPEDESPNQRAVGSTPTRPTTINHLHVTFSQPHESDGFGDG